MATQLVRHRFTVDDYYCMAKAGIFTEDDRVELIDGEVVEMAPIGPSHAGGVKEIAELFTPLRVEGRVIVSVQDPVRLGEHSEPQPDIALLRPRVDFYRSAHPGPADVLLVIEVAESSQEYDREVKAPLYGRAGVPEMWLVDLPADRVLAYSEPSPEGYRVTREARRGETLTPIAFPDFHASVDELLGR